MTKTIAYFLPQYHEIPENNKWWGKGFTEWTNLNNAKKLFRNHNFLTPLNNNQYNLLDVETVEWQTDLMNQYKIDGLCYYHYWFRGKKLLEKPAENLMKYKNINQNFMFMWANHDWTKSWIGKKDLLIKQEYGDKNDWINHINYLISFFKDERYIKVDNKPVFQVYIPEDITDSRMFEIWNKRCKEEGFDGIYLIQNIDNLNKLKSETFNKTYHSKTIMEHSFSMNYWRERNIFMRGINKVQRILNQNNINSISYERLAQTSITLINEMKSYPNINYGIMTGWDNTPRYGKRGYILKNSNPKNFQNYFEKIYSLSLNHNRNFLFVSCWNEWCEGMCLEPSEQYGYKFLESIKKTVLKYA